MLMLLAAAQVQRLGVVILDMESDGVFIERAAGVEVHHVEHGVARSDDVERWIEDVLWNGHRCFLKFARHSGMRHLAQARNLEIPGSSFARPGMTAVVKFPVSESCASRAPAKRVWFPCRSRTNSRRRRGRCRMISCRRTASADGGRFRN